MTHESLREFLEQQYHLYNTPDFIINDPVSVPHKFTKLQDIEIIGFWTAILAWGQRVTIINKANELIQLMENAPFDFIVNHEEKHLKRFKNFKHRTFNYTDTLYFIHVLKKIYTTHKSLEETFLFSCTTCRACMDVCPVWIEPMSKIIELRRTAVDEGSVEPMLQTALMNFQNNGNSQGKPARQRARWTKGLGFDIRDARAEAVDILWFVGDHAALDPRVQDITRKVAALLHQAGVVFGILFDAETNAGNDVRRVGEEGIFQDLAQANIAAINGCTFNRILTTDPHSLNALKNDYRQFGANYSVVHYTELLIELVRAGKIQLEAPQAGEAVTYHDPCYLGRYNGVFDAPRDLIRLAGYTLHEMDRNRENSFCCGAGGGRIWMDDSAMTERPSEMRIKEALSTGNVTAFVVACPKDLIMYSAAVQALGVGDRIRVTDIADLLVPRAA